MRTVQETVANTAERLAVGGTTGVPNPTVIRCTSGTVWIGGSSAVTTSTGFRIANGDSISLDLAGDELWAISDTSATVHLIARY